MLNKVLEAIKDYDCVALFTQDDGLIIDVLKETSLRGEICNSSITWKGVISSCPFITFGQLSSGKFKLVDGCKAPIVCIENYTPGARLYITKDPLAPIPKKAYVIKDELRYPEIKIVPNLPEIAAIQRLPNVATIIKTDGYSHYEQLCQQLILSGIDFGNEQTGEGKLVYITNSLYYVGNYECAIIYGLYSASIISLFDKCNRVILVRPDIDMIPKDVYDGILNAFNEIGGMVGDIDYFSFKLGLHPKRVKAFMSLLEYCGVVKRVYSDDSVIGIRKNGKNEEDVGLLEIPEGNFTIHQLSHIMKMDRRDVLILLKKFEGNGLIFNYQQRFSKSMWDLWNVISYDKFTHLCESVLMSKHLIVDMERNPMAASEFIDKRIERHCLSNKCTSLIKYKNSYNEIKLTCN